jgi:hypothetical protein
MIVKTGMNLYRLNLIRELRERELKSERRNRLSVILSLGCFGFFVLSLLYSALTIMQMEHVLSAEEEKVNRLKVEYQKYTAAKLIVDKSDIELLNGLQGKGIFWTRKLVALAKHLPENFSITAFSFNNDVLLVKGHGYAGPKQDELLILDNYLNELRADSTFSNTFLKIQLNLVVRGEDASRVNFDFSAYANKGAAR